MGIAIAPRHVLLAALISLSAAYAPQAIADGDPRRGKQLAVTCFACHGEDGNSPSPVNPKIGGQHERYLLLALKAYVAGTRADSLMRGAVLDKSEQDLEDIAAYFASQGAPAAASAAPRRGPGGPGAPGGPGGPGSVMKFDHGSRMAEFAAMRARARELAANRPARTDLSVCDLDGANRPADADADGDGVADRFDAAPGDAAEFAADQDADGYFEICNIQQLQALATPVGDSGTPRARSYRLLRDLDLGSVKNFIPIGNCGPTGNCMRALGQFGFAGVFDGQGHTIRNLNIDRPENGGVGLFGVLSEAGVVMDVRLENARVNGRAGTGALVGSNFGIVYRSFAQGAVSGRMAVGGLIGGSGGLVDNSHFEGEVRGEQAIGGLVGDMTGAVYASTSDVDVAATRGVGGLVGLNTFGSVFDSRTAGRVSGSNDIGGLIGVNTDAKVRNSFSVSEVIADSNNVGGLVGFNSLSSVRNSFAAGRVTGGDAVGGLVGRNNGMVANSYAAQEGLDVIGFAVEGSIDEATFAAVKVTEGLTGESTGWAPGVLPVRMTLDYFCDSNGNGFIDPSEQSAANYIWRFDSDAPTLGCATDTESQTRGEQ